MYIYIYIQIMDVFAELREWKEKIPSYTYMNTYKHIYTYTYTYTYILHTMYIRTYIQTHTHIHVG
jgi:hypothetical protein